MRKLCKPIASYKAITVIVKKKFALSLNFALLKLYVTGFTKSGLIVTFNILRNTDLMVPPRQTYSIKDYSYT